VRFGEARFHASQRHTARIPSSRTPPWATLRHSDIEFPNTARRWRECQLPWHLWREASTLIVVSGRRRPERSARRLPAPAQGWLGAPAAAAGESTALLEQKRHSGCQPGAAEHTRSASCETYLNVTWVANAGGVPNGGAPPLSSSPASSRKRQPPVEIPARRVARVRTSRSLARVIPT